MRIFLQLLVSFVAILFLAVMLRYDGAFVLSGTKDANLYEKPHNFIGEGVGIYVINLKRHVEKYKNTYLQLSKLGLPIHRVDAIDGKNLTDLDIHTNYLEIDSYQVYEGENPNIGTIGCYLSHVEAWREFLRSDYEFALIAEDDIEFDHNVLRSSIENLIQNKKLWDVNLFEIHHQGFPVAIKKFNNGGGSLNLYLVDIDHAAAYLINREAAHQLLKKALPIKMPLDHYYVRGWELGGLVITGIEPRIVFQNKASVRNSYRRSTNYIDGKNRKDIPFPAKFHRKIYRIKSDIIRFVYNIKQYIELSAV